MIFHAHIDLPCPEEGCWGRVRFDGAVNSLHRGFITVKGVPCTECDKTFTIERQEDEVLS